MNKREYNSAFDKIKCSESFRRKMENQLSSPAIEMHEYENSVSGIEYAKSQKLKYVGISIAACTILGFGIGTCCHIIKNSDSIFSDNSGEMYTNIPGGDFSKYNVSAIYTNPYGNESTAELDEHTKTALAEYLDAIDWDEEYKGVSNGAFSESIKLKIDSADRQYTLDFMDNGGFSYTYTDKKGNEQIENKMFNSNEQYTKIKSIIQSSSDIFAADYSKLPFGDISEYDIYVASDTAHEPVYFTKGDISWLLENLMLCQWNETIIEQEITMTQYIDLHCDSNGNYIDLMFYPDGLCKWRSDIDEANVKYYMLTEQFYNSLKKYVSAMLNNDIQSDNINDQIKTAMSNSNSDGTDINNHIANYILNSAQDAELIPFNFSEQQALELEQMLTEIEWEATAENDNNFYRNMFMCRGVTCSDAGITILRDTMSESYSPAEKDKNKYLDILKYLSDTRDKDKTAFMKYMFETNLENFSTMTGDLEISTKNADMCSLSRGKGEVNVNNNEYFVSLDGAITNNNNTVENCKVEFFRNYGSLFQFVTGSDLSGTNGLTPYIHNGDGTDTSMTFGSRFYTATNDFLGNYKAVSDYIFEILEQDYGYGSTDDLGDYYTFSMSPNTNEPTEDLYTLVFEKDDASYNMKIQFDSMGTLRYFIAAPNQNVNPELSGFCTYYSLTNVVYNSEEYTAPDIPDEYYNYIMYTPEEINEIKNNEYIMHYQYTIGSNDGFYKTIKDTDTLQQINSLIDSALSGASSNDDPINLPLLSLNRITCFKKGDPLTVYIFSYYDDSLDDPYSAEMNLYCNGKYYPVSREINEFLKDVDDPLSEGRSTYNNFERFQ